jgi:hypothetical protein
MNASSYYISTIGGRVEVWEADSSSNSEISQRITLVLAVFHLSSGEDVNQIKSYLVGPP